MLSLYYRSKNFDLRFFHQIHMWPNNFVIRISTCIEMKKSHFAQKLKWKKHKASLKIAQAKIE